MSGAVKRWLELIGLAHLLVEVAHGGEGGREHIQAKRASVVGLGSGKSEAIK
jgi:hypothetical protein